jgi:hypothetical protein
MVRKVLPGCGILAPLLFVATDILAAMRWEGYGYTDQTISELISIGAPTRPLLVPLSIAYALLVYAFALGVWGSAGEKRALRFVALGLVAKEVLGLVVTLFFPMTQRGVEGTLTDTMHAILTIVGNLFMLLAIGFGAFAFSKRFRLYSIATILLIRRGRRFGGFGRTPDGGKPAHAVDGTLGAHERLRLRALDRGAGHRPLTRPNGTGPGWPRWEA